MLCAPQIVESNPSRSEIMGVMNKRKKDSAPWLVGAGYNERRLFEHGVIYFELESLSSGGADSRRAGAGGGPEPLRPHGSQPPSPMA